MPMYDWLCEKCGKHEVTVYSVDARDTPPEEQKSAECEEHKWDRRIGGKQAVIRGRNWGGGKGNWLLLAGFLGASFLTGCVSSEKLESCEKSRKELNFQLKRELENPDCDRVVWQCFAKEHNRMKRGH